MTFGLTIEKLLLIGLIAVMIIGPERLPAAAESLRRTIQQVRRMARTAQERVREELGPEVADVDWQRLDPRQYDPRRIIREALLTEPDAAPATPRGVGESDPPAPAGPLPAETGSSATPLPSTDPAPSLELLPRAVSTPSAPPPFAETDPEAPSAPGAPSGTPAETDSGASSAAAPARAATAPPHGR